MTGETTTQGRGFGQGAGGNASRGILVIVAAVLVGFVLLRTGLDGPQAAADGPSSVDAAEASSDNTLAEATADEGTAAEAPTSTAAPVTPAVRPPAEVAVLVVNGTDGPVSGVAGAGTDKLKTEAYTTLSPANAAPLGVGQPSAVYYMEGFEAEANVVATILGADPTLVVLPLDPATVPVSDTQSANIVVVVGNDGVISV